MNSQGKRFGSYGETKFTTDHVHVWQPMHGEKSEGKRTWKGRSAGKRPCKAVQARVPTKSCSDWCPCPGTVPKLVLGNRQKAMFRPGGVGGTQQSFIRERSAPRSKPLPFYISFLREKVPLSYTFRRKWYPFHIPTEPVSLNFSFEKTLKILR